MTAGRFVRIVALEVRALLRELVPYRWLRWVGAGGLLAVVVLLCAFVLVVPLPDSRPAFGFGQLAGLGVAVAVFAWAVGSVVVAGLLRDPGRIATYRAAPVGPAVTVWSTLASILVPVLAVVGLFVAPVLALLARTEPIQVLVSTLVVVAAVGWAGCLSMGTLVSLARWKGRDFAARAGRGGGLLIGLACAVFAERLLGSVLHFRSEATVVAGFLVASAALPVVMRWAAESLLDEVRRPSPRPDLPDPEWGTVRWWSRLRRTPFVGRSLSVIAGLLVALGAGVPFLYGVTALLLVAIASVPVNELWRPEFERPERLTLAPRAGRHRASVVRCVALPTSAVLAAAAWLVPGAGPTWRLAVTGLVFVAPLIGLIRRRWPRWTAQASVLAAALATEVVR